MSAPTPPQFTIQVDGGDGEPGTSSYSWIPRHAGRGYHGVNGRSAGGPGAGGSGGFLSVMLSPSTVWQGGICVDGIGTWEGSQWQVPPGNNLFLSARGGGGGDGGLGENGQAGGKGRNGWAATRDRYAENGGDGKDGGSGGYGTHGAAGGNGGTIEVSVREEHTNLLIAVMWNVSGGNGGAAGAHGSGGAGGAGGKGGDGLTWEIDKLNTWDNWGQKTAYVSTERHSHPPGKGGRAGCPGWTPSEPLYDGAPGLEGVFSFFILKRDGTREQYHGCYDLTATGFQIVDENDDGVYEPGEHIFVKNIWVHNAGVMPSPSLTTIPLTIHSGGWLYTNPAQGSVSLPTSIPPGETREIPGFLKAFIKQEPGQRLNCSTPLVANDHIKVFATMPGINRVLNSFVLQSPLCVRYPLELLPPVYLPTVAVGDTFTIQWKIRNVSRKTYGAGTDPMRLSGTRIHKTGDFHFASSPDANETTRYIEAVRPGEEAIFEEIFQVSHSAEPFSRGKLFLEMLLAEPGDDPSLFSTQPCPDQGLRPIGRCDLDFQISASYRYSADASFLLLVNNDTPTSLIREILAYVSERLHLNMDVYNLCLSGTLVDKDGKHIMMNYAGKTIIILANPMDYFGEKGRLVYEFIDPWMASVLLTRGTGIAFLGLQNTHHLVRSWANLVVTPEFQLDDSGADGSFHARETDSLMSRLSQMDLNSDNQSRPLRGHTVQVKKGMLKSHESSAAGSGKKLAKQLANVYPSRSYVVSTDNGTKTDAASDPTKIVVRECIPSNAVVLASSQISCTSAVDRLPASLEYLIVATMPLEKRFEMLWTGVVNQGEEGHHLPEKVRQFLAESIKYDLLRETSRFCEKAPLRDPAAKSAKPASLLPTLSRFVSAIKESKVNINALPSDQEWILDILAWLYADTDTKGTSLLDGTNGRKRIVRDLIGELPSRSRYSISSASSSGSRLQDELKRRLPPIQTYLKQLRKSKTSSSSSSTQSPVVAGTIAAIANSVGLTDGNRTGTPFVDISVLMRETRGALTFFLEDTDRENTRRAWQTLMSRMTADQARSAEQIRLMVINR